MKAFLLAKLWRRFRSLVCSSSRSASVKVGGYGQHDSEHISISYRSR